MKFLLALISFFTASEWSNFFQLVSSQTLTDDRHGIYVGPPISPTGKPTKFPSIKPTKVSSRRKPTIKPSPSSRKSSLPSTRPFKITLSPSRRNSKKPSVKKSVLPSMKPTRRVTASPSRRASKRPSIHRSKWPSKRPSLKVTTSPSRRTSKKPSIKRTLLPSRKPTRRVTNVPSRRTSRKPSMRKTILPTKRSSNKGTAMPFKSVTKKPSYNLSRRPSKKPTSSRMSTQKPSIPRSKIPSLISTFSSSSPNICNSTGAGNFGISTSDSVVVLYGYQMQISPTADSTGLANKMELAIGNIVWPSISSCSNDTKRLLESSNVVKVSGLSYLPKDGVSDCVSISKGSKCISVSGKMTVYFAAKSRLRSRSLFVNRYTLDLNQAMSDTSTSINQIIDSGIRSGLFLSVSSDIQGMTYVGPGPIQQPQVNSSNRFPAYGYAIIVLSIAAIAATVIAALKLARKRVKRQHSSHQDDIENVQMSDGVQFISEDGVLAQVVEKNPVKSESPVKRLKDPVNDGIEKGHSSSVEKSHKDEERITDLEESSSVESNTDSKAPLVKAETTKSESPDHTVSLKQTIDVKKPDSTDSDLDLNRTGSDESSAYSRDHDSQSPLLSRNNDAEYEHIGNTSFDEQNVLASDSRESSDDSSVDVRNRNSKVPLIHT